MIGMYSYTQNTQKRSENIYQQTNTNGLCRFVLVNLNKISILELNSSLSFSVHINKNVAYLQR